MKKKHQLQHFENKIEKEIKKQKISAVKRIRRERTTSRLFYDNMKAMYQHFALTQK